MLAKRIIPCLDVKDGRVVKGVNFQGLKDVDNPVKLAEFYNNEGADELVFYDISASVEDRGIFTDILKKTAEKVFIPLTVGGGIRSVADFDIVLNCGADKVSVNSGAIENPQLINEAAKLYGSQCVVFSIDVKRVGGSWNVFAKGGREDTGLNALEWIKKGEFLGAGELVINSMDTDGVKKGFDMELLKEVCAITSLPVVASGGAGTMQDFAELFALEGVDAGLAASVFHYGEIKIPELKRFLQAQGVEMRIKKTP